MGPKPITKGEISSNRKGQAPAADKKIGFLLFALDVFILIGAIFLFVMKPACSQMDGMYDYDYANDYNLSELNHDVQFHGHDTPIFNQFQSSSYGSSYYGSSSTSGSNYGSTYDSGSNPYGSTYGTGSSSQNYYDYGAGTSSYGSTYDSSYGSSSLGSSYGSAYGYDSTYGSPYGSTSGIGSSPYGSPYGSTSGIGSSPYGSPYGSTPSTGSSPYGSPYGYTSSTGSSPYGSPYGYTSSTGSSPYGSPYGSTYGTVPSPYGSPYGSTYDTGSSPYGSSYGSTYGTDLSSYGYPYGSTSPYGLASPYGSTSPYGSSPYGSSYSTGSYYGTGSSYGTGYDSSSIYGTGTSAYGTGYGSPYGTSPSNVYGTGYGYGTTPGIGPSLGVSTGSGGIGGSDGVSTAGEDYAYGDIIKLIPEDKLANTNFECGVSEVKPNLKTGRIVGGSVAVQDSWPWVVSVAQYTSRGGSTHKCGGTIVSPRHVISAIHCFEPKIKAEDKIKLKKDYTKETRLYIGKYDLDTPGEMYMVAKIRAHPKGVMFPITIYDLVLITTAKEITFSQKAQPACLPPLNKELSSDTWCWAYGWGATENTGGDCCLKQVKLQVGSEQECVKEWSPISSMDHNYKKEVIVCAGKEKGQDTCQGDSGGPFTCQENGKTVLYGATSYGGACGSGKLAAYASVSFNLEWFCCFMADIPGCKGISCNPKGQ
ncbi:uncharacterized protein LOC120346824 [Styela clava]